MERTQQMIDKLLVALDGSNHSLKAVDYAAEIAASRKAELIILNVVKSHEFPEGLREYAEAEHVAGTDIEILKRLSGYLIENAELRAKELGANNVVGEVEEGPVARTIIARAEHHDVDMIVVGSRGLSNIEATLHGGVSHRVALLAKCPILTVK
jgi:nucleotide-binding universal stress UspA family protein